MEMVDLSVRKLNRTLSLMDQSSVGVKPMRRIGIKIRNFFIKIPRLFTRTRASSSQVRKLVKYYMFQAKPADRSEEKTRLVHALYDRLSRLRKRPGTSFAAGIEKNAIDELAKASLDPSKGFRKLKKLPAPSQRVLFNLSADQFGQAALLQGSPHLPMLQYVQSYFEASKKQRGSAPVNDAVMKQIGQAQALLEAKDLVKCGKTQFDQAIAKGESLLIPGGWKGLPMGESLYYQITPQGQGKVSFRVYTLSAGSDQNGMAIDDIKSKARPYCEWRGIDTDKISNPVFWKIIQEMVKSGDVSLKNMIGAMLSPDGAGFGGESYGPGHLQGLRQYLAPKEADGEAKADSIFMNPQQSGVHKSLFGFLRANMSQEEYRRMVCSIRLQALVDKVHKVGITQPKWWHRFVDWLPSKVALVMRMYFDIAVSKESEGRLIEKSRDKLASKISRAYNDGVIGKDFLIRAQGLLTKVSTKVEAIRNDRVKKANVEKRHYAGMGQKLKQPLVGVENPIHKLLNSKQAFAPSAHTDVAAAIVKLSSPDQAAQATALKEVRLLSEGAWKAGEDRPLYGALMQFIRNLSIEKDFWKHSPEAAKLMIADLGVIEKRLFQLTFKLPQPNSRLAERTYALAKLHHIQVELLKSVDADLAKNFPIPYGILQNPLFSLYDPRMQKEFQQIQEAKNEYDGRFAYKGGSMSDGERKMEFSFSTPKNGEHQPNFWDYLEKLIPTDKLIPAKEQHGPAHVKNGRLFMSDGLPEWVKSLRDAYVCETYYFDSWMPKAGFESVDRAKGLDFEFKFSATRDVASIACQLKGVTAEIVRHPDNKIDGGKKSLPQYAKMHRPVKPGSLMHDLLKEVDDAYSWDEKDLIGKGHPEQLTELLNLFLKQGNAGVIKLMGYFNKHPERHEELDFQILFDLVFNPGILEANQKEHPDLAKTLSRFLNTQYTWLIEQQKIQPAVNLMQAMRRFALFFPGEATLQESSLKLQALLKRQGLEPEQKSAIYAELLAGFAGKKQLTDDELFHLSVGHTYLIENPLPSKWRDPVTFGETGVAFNLHVEALRSKFHNADGTPNQPFLTQVVAAMRPKAEAYVWKKIEGSGKELAFATSDDKIHFMPRLGRLISPGSVVQLPMQIRQHPDFVRLFPGVETAEIYPGGYRFLDSQQRETLVQFEEEKIIVDQKLTWGKRELWCRFVPPSQLLNKKWHQNVIERVICAVFIFLSKFITRLKPQLEQLRDKLSSGSSIESALGSRHLVNQYSYWRSINDPTKLYGIDLKSGKQELEVVYKSNAIQSVKKSDGALLKTPTTMLSSFEVSEYVQQWSDRKGKTTKVELPRFGISFTPVNGRMSRLSCDQFPGFEVEQGAKVATFGSYPHYLILKNEKGERKLLLPKFTFKMVDPLKEYPDALKPTYKVERCLEEGDVSALNYYSFDLKGDKLDSPSRPANLYLANVLTHVSEKSQAIVYLKKLGQKLTAYTEEERQILSQLIESQKVTLSGEAAACALRAYAGFLLTKNCQDHHVENPLKEQIPQLYLAYLNVSHSSSILPFEKEEELFMAILAAQASKSSMPSPALLRRIVELKNDEEWVKGYEQMKRELLEAQKAKGEKLDPADPKKPQAKLRFSNWGRELPSYTYNSFKNFEELKKKGRMTLPNELIKSSFHLLAQVAKQGSSTDKEWLRTLLCFVQKKDGDEAKGTDVPQKRAIALTYILDYPEMFSLHPGANNGNGNFNQVDNWNAETVKTLNILLEQHPLPVQEAQKREPIILPTPPLQAKADAAAAAPLAFPLTFKGPGSWASSCQGLFSEQQQAVARGNKGFEEWLKPQKGDGLEGDEYLRLQQANRVYIAKADTFKRVSLATGGIAAVEALLKADVEKNREELKRMERAIEMAANLPPAVAAEKAKRALNEWAGKEHPLKMDELIIAFGQKNGAAIKRKNPQFNDHAIASLFNQIGSYLLLATHEQQRDRALHAMKSYGEAVKRGDAVEQETLLQQIASELTAQQNYDSARNPEYLVFEHYAKIMIRKEQFDILKLFFESGDLNVVKELIMGWGKSSVLLPLLGILRAKPGVLSLLIVPPDQFVAVADKVQAVQREAYARHLRTLIYDRDMPFTVESLFSIFTDLENAVKNQECMIMTGRTVQSLLLKCMEHVRDCRLKKELTADDEMKFAYLQKILRLMKQSGHPLVDEIDSVLDVMMRLIYSFGNKQPANMADIELIAHLYTLLLTDPDLKKLGRVECDLSADPKAEVLTEETFDLKVPRPMAQAFLNHLKTARFTSQALTQKVQAFASTADQALVVAYLSRQGTKGELANAQKLFDAQELDIRNVLALASEQITKLLKHTLTRPCNQKYGVDKEDKSPLAIPFRAANQPNKGSQFANPFVTMNYTLQFYLKEGISRKTIKNVVKALQVKANRQTREEGIPLQETAGFKTFKSLCGNLDIPSLNLKKIHYEQLEALVNSRFDLKRDFIVQGILPTVEVYEGVLGANSHNLAGFFTKMAGMTATCWNAEALHGKFKVQRDEQIDVEMLNLLFEKGGPLLQEIREETPDAMFAQILAKNNPCDMMVDGGGYFKVKEGIDLPIARAQAKATGKPVLFFNDKGIEMVTDGSRETPADLANLRPEERKVFLAQRFGIGSNIKIGRKAKGVVTISRDTTLPKFLQYMGRLYREQQKTQEFDVFVSEEVAAVIRQLVKKTPDQPLTLGDMVRFLVHNKCERKGRDNFVAMMQELQEIPQQALVDALLNCQGLENIPGPINELLNCWFKKAVMEPAELYGALPVEEPREVVAERKRKEAIAELTALINSHAQAAAMLGWTAAKAEEKVNEIVKRMTPHLPERLITRPKGSFEDEDQAVEMETELEAMAELEQQEERKRSPIKLGKVSYFPRSRLDLQNLSFQQNGYFDLSAYMQTKESLKAYAEAFKGIDLTLNVLAWPEKAASIADTELFGPYRTPLHFVRVEANEVCILSEEDHVGPIYSYSLDVNAFTWPSKLTEPWEIKRIRDKVLNSPVWFPASADEKKELAEWDAKAKVHLDNLDPAKFAQSEAFAKIVKIKFLNGDSDYTLAEQKILREWFKQHGVMRLQELFVKHILKGFPSKADAYRGSALERLFNGK